MIRVKVAVAVALLSVWAGPAMSQDLKAGLDAVKRGQWAAALQELAPLAESGSAPAQYALGTMYANGDGVEPDLVRAEKLLRLAASGGEWRARAHLEFMRVSGQLAPTGAAASNGTAAPPLVGDGWRVQLATVPTSESAQREFRRLSRQYGEILAGTDLLAPPFTMPDGAQVVRVQAGPLSETRARDICAKLRDLNAGCRVIRPEG
jgi:TPR repeat protein